MEGPATLQHPLHNLSTDALKTPFLTVDASESELVASPRPSSVQPHADATAATPAASGGTTASQYLWNPHSCIRLMNCHGRIHLRAAFSVIALWAGFFAPIACAVLPRISRSTYCLPVSFGILLLLLLFYPCIVRSIKRGDERRRELGERRHRQWREMVASGAVPTAPLPEAFDDSTLVDEMQKSMQSVCTCALICIGLVGGAIEPLLTLASLMVCAVGGACIWKLLALDEEKFMIPGLGNAKQLSFGIANFAVGTLCAGAVRLCREAWLLVLEPLIRLTLNVNIRTGYAPNVTLSDAAVVDLLKHSVALSLVALVLSVAASWCLLCAPRWARNVLLGKERVPAPLIFVMHMTVCLQSVFAVDLPAMYVNIGMNRNSDGGFPDIPFYVYAANVVMCVAASCVLGFMGGLLSLPSQAPDTGSGTDSPASWITKHFQASRNAMLTVVLPLCLGLPAVFVVALVRFGGAGTTSPPALATLIVSMLAHAMLCVAFMIWKLIPEALDVCQRSLMHAGLGGAV